MAITGTVKWFDMTKGIGFITGDDGKDYYIHFTKIKKGHTRTVLLNNEKVTFNPNKDDKGRPIATGVCIEPVTKSAE